MKIASSILYGVLVMLGGALAMVIIDAYGYKPNRTHRIDLNRDGIQDLVITTRGGIKYPLMGQWDGGFKPLDVLEKEQREWYNEMKDSLGTNYERMKDSVETEISQQRGWVREGLEKIK